MEIIYKVHRYLKKHQNLVRDILIGVLLVLLLICVGINKSCVDMYTTEEHSLKISKEALTNQNDKLREELNECNIKLSEQELLIEDLQTQLNDMKSENAELLKNSVSSVTYPDTEYIQCRYIWVYLTNEIGLNNYVAAGIMGNIMTEVGGQTLDISKYSCRESNGGMYYGICQWAGDRKERLLNEFGGSLEAQCKFLHIELFEIIPAGSSFYELQDEQEAALYFAKHFERCAEWSYDRRQTSATYALEYFTGNDR